MEELDSIRESLLKRLEDSTSVQPTTITTCTGSTNDFIGDYSCIKVDDGGGILTKLSGTSDSFLMETTGDERSNPKEREPVLVNIEGASVDSDSSSDFEVTDNEKERNEENQKEQINALHLNTPPLKMTHLSTSPSTPPSMDHTPSDILSHHSITLKSPSPQHQSLALSPTRPQKSSPLLRSMRSPSPTNNSLQVHQASLSPTINLQHSSTLQDVPQSLPSPINLHSSPLRVCIPPSHSSPASHITPSPTPSPVTNDDTVEEGEEEEEPFDKELTSNGEEEIPEEEEEEEEREEQREEQEGERENEEEEEGEVEEVKGIVLNESILDEMLQDKDGVNLNASINTSSSLSPLKNELNQDEDKDEDIGTLVNSPRVRAREDDELNQTLLSSDLEERNEVQRILQTLLKNPPYDDDNHSSSTDDGRDDQMLHSVSPTLDTTDSTTIKEELPLGQCSESDSLPESDESLNDESLDQSHHHRR